MSIVGPVDGRITGVAQSMRARLPTDVRCRNRTASVDHLEKLECAHAGEWAAVRPGCPNLGREVA